MEQKENMEIKNNQNESTNNADTQNENETLKKSKEFSKKAYESAKDATKNATNAFKTLICDPVSKQKEVIESLGSNNSLSAGIVFIVCHILTFILFFLVIARKATSMFSSYSMYGYEAKIKFSEILKSLLYPTIFIATLILGFFIIGHLIYKNNKSISTHIFSAGIVSIPLSIMMILLLIFFKVSFIAYFIILAGLSSFVLILNGSLETTYQQNKKLALIEIPVIIYVTFIFYYIISKILS